jgi:hypothetical protein
MVMLLVTKQQSKYPYASQNNDQLFEICNAVKLYLETDNILGTCSVSALDICKNYLH